jgi:hypothetical protein
VALLVLAVGTARADKPEKLRVAMGAWTGPHASSFKSGLRGGLGKDCVFVRAKAARSVIDGEVTEENKKFTVKVIVKSAKTGEVAEQREYKYSKPSMSSAQSKKIGHDVVEMVRRAPAE